MKIQETITELIQGGYVLPAGDRYIFTTKFYSELKKQVDPDVKKAEYDVIVKIAKELKQQMIKKGWKEPDTNIQEKTGQVTNVDSKTAYIQFIKDAGIPPRAQSGVGTTYEINQYSEEGKKAFEKLMKENIDYQILVQSTNLYYKSPVYKQKIGNYIAQGTWRTHYDRYVLAKSKGMEAQMIKEQTQNGRSKYEF
jgi:DNA-binding LacI/PurR family transcriptional regulator